MKALAVLCLLASVAAAQPTPGPPGLTRVNHDATMTGDGKNLTPLSTRLAVGGGLQGGGAVSLGLVPCSTGQVLAWSGSAYACTDGATLAIAGTVAHLPLFTPDGHHLGSTPITYSSGADEYDAPLTRLQLGQGAPIGAPTNAPTIAACANTSTLTCPTGVLTGAYKYTHYETDGNGHSTQSPASAPVTLASQAMLVDVDLPRTGIGEHHVCRTLAGGSTFFEVHNFGGGYQYFNTEWVDNTPDVSLVTPCPTTDTTALYTFDITNGVKFLRTPPGTGSSVHDLTLVTSDPAAGTFALDSYGGIAARTRNGTNYEGFKTGDSGSEQLGLYWSPDRDASTGMNASGAITQVWSIGGKGATLIQPLALIDSGTTRDTRALTILATLPASATADHSGVNIDITSIGSASFSQNAVSVSLEAGYTGSSSTHALTATNATATTGKATAFQGFAAGSGGYNIGVQGIAANATHNVALYAGLGVTMPTAGNVDAALYTEAATTGKSHIVSYNSSGVTKVFEVTNGGGIFGSGNGMYLSADGALGFQAGTNGLATGYINFYGYAPGNVPGTTQFRNLILADGKGATACTLTGSTKTLNCTGLQVGGVAVSTTTGTVTSIATSSGITGGTITSTGTIGYDSSVIQSRVSGTCTGPNAIRAVASDGTVTCTTGVLSTSNLGGTSNHLIKITGTNTGGDSTMIDDAILVSTTEPLATGTNSGIGQLSVLSADSGAGFGTLTGTPGRTWSLFGPGAASTTGEYLALGYSTTDHAAKIASVAGGTAWKEMDFSAASYKLEISSSTTNALTFDSTGLGVHGTIVATSTISTASTGDIGWGDLTTKIHGTNTGGGSGSITLNTNSSARLTIDNTGAATFAQTLTATGAVTHSSTEHTVGAVTLDSTLRAGITTIGGSAGTSSATGMALMVSNAGTTCSEVRDTTDSVETERCASSSGGFDGTFTNHSYFLQTNATNALKINTSQQVEALQAFLVDGNTTLGAANTNTITLTAKIADHVYYGGTAQVIGNYSCAGATMAAGSTDERGTIVTPDTSCTLTFTTSYTTNAPKCTANASSAIAVGVASTTTNVTFTMGSKPVSMTWHCDGGL